MGDKSYLSSNPLGMPRWLPSMIVMGVVAGFIALSWYAYRSGTQYMNGELLVVEADKTPVKEKPLDAGGMQFPNQDKTVFDMFSSNSGQPPKVERVLPTPEEPVDMPADTPQTDNQTANGASQKGQDILETVKKPMAAESPQKDSKPANATPPQTAEQPTMYVAQAQEDSLPPVPQEEQKKTVSKTNAAATQQMDTTVTSKEKPADNARIQLGAYHSQREAKEAWAAMQKKYKDLLTGTPNIVEADLGDKGIYFRLQMGGIASPAEAKVLCSKLTAAGQACIIPIAK